MIFTSDPAIGRAIERAAELIRRQLCVGLETPREIEKVADWISCPPRGRRTLLGAVRACLRRELAKKRKLEAAWPKVTDSDRFDTAGAALRLQGIHLLPFFSCCPTCAPGDLDGLLATEKRAGRQPRAAFYFFPQDVSDAFFSDGQTVKLEGVKFADEDNSDDVVALVRAALADSGLDVGQGEGLSVHMRWLRRTPQ